MYGYNTDLHTQMAALEDILKMNHALYSVIEKASGVGLDNYYIGAGCITQTVWNYQSGNDPCYGISDIDFVYYDASDLSYEAENDVIGRVMDMMRPCTFELDIKNQARVHLWYKSRFGYDIEPYASVESAINTWPTTATSVGVRLEGGQMKIYAPFGLNDMFGMTVRANKTQITEEIYMRKVDKWIAKWPGLKVVPW